MEKAVAGCSRRTRWGRAQLKKLKVYAGPEHPHAAQQPQAFEINQVAQYPARKDIEEKRGRDHRHHGG
jgi:large subunit ribosomal protein L13